MILLGRLEDKILIKISIEIIFKSYLIIYDNALYKNLQNQNQLRQVNCQLFQFKSFKNQMMIINSKEIQNNSQIPLDFNFKNNSYVSTNQSTEKSKQQRKILNWINGQFGMQPNSKKILKVQELKTGVVLAQILYNLMSSQITEEQNFLQNIQINNLNQINCIHNLSVILYFVKKYFQVYDGQYGLDLYRYQKPELLYANIDLMRMFLIKVIMKIPIINKNCQNQQSYVQKVKLKTKKDDFQYKPAQFNIQQHSKHSLKKNSSVKNKQFVGIQDLSEIANLQSLQFQSKTSQKYQSYQFKDKKSIPVTNQLKAQNQLQNQNYYNQIQKKLSTQKQSSNRDEIYIQQQRENKICQLLDWMHDTYNLPIQNLQAHQLLGQLTNSVLGNSRLNEQVVKPIHFEMGSACVYRKVVQAFLKCERMNKTSLIQMSCDIQNGVISQQIYWKVIQDIWCLVNNKISFIQLYTTSQKNQKAQNQENLAGQQEKQNNQILENEIIQINYKIHQNMGQKNTKKQSKPSHPLYEKQVVMKVQMWLQQMGFSYSLEKSKEAKIIKLNPLLNGTLMGSLLIRLKIGKLVLIKQPNTMKQVGKNIEQIKIALSKRGYECGRKFDMFRPGINFYLGLIGQIRTLYEQKESIKKEGIADNLRYKKQCKQSYKIYNKEKEEVADWILKQFSIKLNINEDLQVSLLFQVFQACISATLLRQTTFKIVQKNVTRILQELRSIGLSQYYTIKTQDITNKDSQIKTDLKWMILKDLKSLVCGSRGFVQYYA